MKQEQILFDKIETLEWYDGIVRGIGVGEGKSYLIILASWRIDENSRLYLILDLDENSRHRLTANFENDVSKEVNWKAFGVVFDDFIKNYTGNVYSIRGEIVAKKKYETEPINAELLDRIIPYDVQNTIRLDI